MILIIILFWLILKITSSERKKLVAKQKMKNDSSYRIMPLLASIKELIIQRMERIKRDKNFFKSSYTKEMGGIYMCRWRWWAY